MPDVEVSEEQVGTNGISRRRFIGYLIAAPTLVAAADLRGAPAARASVATVQPVDFFDLTDLLTDAADLTASLIAVTLNPMPPRRSPCRALRSARVSRPPSQWCSPMKFELPLDKIDITLSDARPEFVEFNQSTGGSNSMHTL